MSHTGVGSDVIPLTSTARADVLSRDHLDGGVGGTGLAGDVPSVEHPGVRALTHLNDSCFRMVMVRRSRDGYVDPFSGATLARESSCIPELLLICAHAFSLLLLGSSWASLAGVCSTVKHCDVAAEASINLLD